VKYDERFNLFFTFLLLYYDWLPLRWSELLYQAATLWISAAVSFPFSRTFTQSL